MATTGFLVRRTLWTDLYIIALTRRVNFAVANGGSFIIFASDTSNNLFAAGSSFTLTVAFADGSTATAGFTIPTPPPANIALNYNGKLRDRVGRGDLALGADSSFRWDLHRDPSFRKW